MIMTKKLIRTGIAGLDEMLGGGITQGHTIVAMGSFGTGKTTFSLNFIHQGLMEGESAIFISLEEDEESILESARAYGWDLEPFIQSKKLYLLKLEPQDASATLMRIKTDLPKAIKSVGAKRIVFDSASLLNMIIDSEKEKRSALFNLSKLLKESGATSLLTAEVRSDNPSASRDGLAEYVADGVILLSYAEGSGKRELQLTIRVLKMRRQAHSRAIKPYTIGQNGIQVHTQSEVF